MTTIEDIAAQMREAAEKATKGPWQVLRTNFDYNVPTSIKGCAMEIRTSWVHPQSKDYDIVVVPCKRSTDDERYKYGVHMAEEDAAHIAASNPANVIAVLDVLAEAQREIAEQCRINGKGAERELALLTRVGELERALAHMVEHYISLADSGDAGFWNPEEEPEVKAARAVLAKGARA